jgi:hypothetical protein
MTNYIYNENNYNNHLKNRYLTKIKIIHNNMINKYKDIKNIILILTP